MEYDVAPVLHRIGAFYFLYNTAPNGDVRALDNGNSQIVYPGGDVSMICPDGTVLPPFDAGKSIIGPWGIAIDGNDNVWVANSTGRSIAQLCRVRTGTCPPGFKTGDPISPSSGYVGGLQIITDVDIDPAGNVWAANNWDRPDEGFKKVPDEALSTRWGGNGAVVFFGLAKPVRTPLIGPVEAQ
jgi:hypothetical protein